MLKMNNITKTFNSGTVDERVALDHLTLTLHDGDFVSHRRQRRGQEHHAERHLRHLAA